MANPVASYAASGIVFDTDGSTKVSGAIVVAFNGTKGSVLPSNAQITTDATGEYTLDFANFPGGYSQGDVIFVTAFKGMKSIDYKHTIDTATGFVSKNVSLHFGEANLGSCRIVNIAFVTTANGNATFFDRKTADVLFQSQDLLGTPSNAYFGEMGIPAQGGVATIYSNDNGGAGPILPCQAYVTIKKSV